MAEPPAKLRSYREADWLPLVDATQYREDDWRDVRDRVPVGPVTFLFEDWVRDQAWHLYCSAQLAWLDQHGWPGGLDFVQLMQQQVQRRTARFEQGRRR